MKRTLALILIALPGFAGEPWRAPQARWTDEDARRILSASPWAKPIGGSKATIRWQTARPVRLALDKLKIGSPTAACQSCYAVAIVGLPVPEKAPKLEASLKATGREAIAAYDMRVVDDAIVFFFPRLENLGEPVVFRLPLGVKIGNDIQFDALVGGRAVKQKFSLRTMTYDGKLEL